MHDKIYFNYSGPTPLENDDELDIIDEMIDDGPKLHEYLPVLYALGISALLPRVTPAQREEISYALSDPKDKRQAQILIQYINVFKACLAAIEEFGLEAPPLFTSGEIDMTSLIYFNHPPEVNISPALMTIDQGVPKFKIEHESLCFWKVGERLHYKRSKIPSKRIF